MKSKWEIIILWENHFDTAFLGDPWDIEHMNILRRALIKEGVEV